MEVINVCEFTLSNGKKCSKKRDGNTKVCKKHRKMVSNGINEKLHNGTPFNDIDLSCIDMKRSYLSKYALPTVMGECTICMNEEREVNTFSCKHTLCYKCRSKLRTTLCPFCRHDLTLELPKLEVSRIKRIMVHDKEQRNRVSLQDYINNTIIE